LNEIDRLLSALRQQRAKVQGAIEALEALSTADISPMDLIEQTGAIARRTFPIESPEPPARKSKSRFSSRLSKRRKSKSRTDGAAGAI
jgi:hypothetical protein